MLPQERAIEFSGDTLTLRAGTKGDHRPIDRFFSTLADDQGHLSIGVVLSGTATDGTLGLEAIKAAGGITFAQDDSAQQDSMPHSAIAAGCVDAVLAPAQIAQELARLAQLPYLATAPSGRAAGAEFERVLDLLRNHSGVDFGQYKASSLERRVRRRMALHRLPGLADYLRLLQDDSKEVEALYQDVLIGVTSFFRDPEAFEVLKSSVFPRLFRGRSRHEPFRAWVLGCASGEECYSLAIALVEYTTSVRSPVPIVVYATDLNGAAIDKARRALYPKSIEQDLTPERLRRYFLPSDGGYRIVKSVRDLCVFARQNVLTDPPFSRMDLITCRNVLIYMEPVLQKKLLPVLHYALKPDGALLLGPSETTGASRDLFDAEDAHHKIFRKRAVGVRIDQVIPHAPLPRPRERTADAAWHDPLREAQLETQREADRALLAHYAPAGVLVNEQFEILQFRGDTGPFLTPAPGRPSLNLLKMTREGLLVAVRSGLEHARQSHGPVRIDVRVRSGSGYIDASLNIVPVRQGSKEICYWVMFEQPGAASAEPTAPAPVTEANDLPAEITSRDRQILQLTQELTATREYLQSVIEQQEAANEELQSANEEVQSTNEELQSINEELETSKEEIQASNEELSTVNDELQVRNEELARATNDLTNIFGSVQMPIVMVWPDLRIRRFTPPAEKLFNLIGTDVGRPIGDISFNFPAVNVAQLLREVIASVTPREVEVQDGQGHWFQLRLRPYRTQEDRVDGAVLVLIDIDRLKQSQEVQLRQASLLELAHDAIFVRTADGIIVYWNRGAESLYGYSSGEAVGNNSHSLLHASATAVAAIDAALQAHGSFGGEVAHLTRSGKQIVVESLQVVFGDAGQGLVLETNRDITERKALEQALRQRIEELALADRHKNEFLAMLAHELRNPLAPLLNAAHILKLAPESEATQRGAIESIQRQVRIMARLVDDLLDAARIARGKMQLRAEVVDLCQVLNDAVEAARPEIEARHHQLTVSAAEEPMRVLGDPVRLEQVFANLLQNAAKYTPDGGQLGVTLQRQPAADSGPGEIAIRVRDNGVGIEPALLPRVFDLFVQADRSLSRKPGGLGVGLYVVRNVVQLHGGRVTAVSHGVGSGAEFAVVLPALGAAEAAAAAAAPDSTPAARRLIEPPPTTQARAARILVVDDSAEAARTLADVLRMSGHEVQTAFTGAQALALASSFRPQVVLLDIGLPDLDGYTVARRLRDDPNINGSLLVAVSGYGGPEAERRASQAGFDLHLTKPVDPERLAANIAGHAAARAASEPART